MATAMTSFAGILADLEEHRGAIVSSSTTPADQRLKVRYPLELSVRFRSRSDSARFSGAGRTVNLSSGGVLVISEYVAQYEIRVGARMEMSIEWPSMLDGRIPLQFVAIGRVLRLGASVFAATFERHQFRTLRSSSQQLARLGGDVVQWTPRKLRGD